MDTNHKLKPLNTDITFCEHPSARSQCATCARNALRYDLSGFSLLSFLASPIIQPNKPCKYYLEDARKEP